MDLSFVNPNFQISAFIHAAFVILLGLEIQDQYNYIYPDNYLTSTLQEWRPLLFLGPVVDDNACQRTKFGSRLTYDFIIVGAGAAGSVIASRLSENCDFDVLLIEAGSDPLAESMVPRYFPYGLNTSRIWDETAEATNFSANSFRKGCPMQHGKALYVCGCDRDYNSWHPDWSYSNVLPYIKKSENNLDSSISGNGYHGVGGPLTVISYSNPDPIANTFKNGFVQLGYKALLDFNAGQINGYNGYVKIQATVRGGERCTAYQAFLAPVYRNRTNLTFMKDSLVTKVLFTGATATGVNVKTNDPDCPNIILNARKEVIISAGGQNSPKILLNSGIGKAADLPAGVTQVKNLPVGDNYQDHFSTIHFVQLNPNGPPQQIADVLNTMYQYNISRTGNFAELPFNSGGFFNTLDINGSYPDVQIIVNRMPKNLLDLQTILINTGFTDHVIAQLLALNQAYDILLIRNVVLNPKSRGTIKLRDINPDSPPKVTTNFASAPEDVDTLLRGINMLINLMNTTSLQGASASLFKFDIDECNAITDYPSTAYWKCYMKYMSSTIYHPVGTCKMGINSTDPGAVVDEKLKVRGISRLRVADASVMPTIISSNTQCAVYMIGEKVSDMIKTQYA